MRARSVDIDGLRQAVQAREWYHTLELAPGVVTPGWLDHRGIRQRVPLPASLSGRRCLDVGTFNGFWAFEMERRGGTVTAIDVFDPQHWDWPLGDDAAVRAAIGRRMGAGDGFDIARSALDSAVERLDLSVYDLDPQHVGRFDVVYLGSLLVHLRDPVRALERVRSVCEGVLVVVDGIDLPLTLRAPRSPLARFDGAGRPWWWYPSLAGLGRIVESAGFSLLRVPRPLFVPPGAGWRPPRRNPRGLLSREGRYRLTAAWLGDPHATLVAAPR